MKPTRSGTKWVHVSCALWIPEVSLLLDSILVDMVLVSSWDWAGGWSGSLAAVELPDPTPLSLTALEPGYFITVLGSVQGLPEVGGVHKITPPVIFFLGTLSWLTPLTGPGLAPLQLCPGGGHVPAPTSLSLTNSMQYHGALGHVSVSFI